MEASDKLSLVVVEDDPAQRRLMEVVLAAEGFDVRSAANGEVADALVHELMPAAVIADVMMPTVDGFELCRRLRLDLRTAEIPFIFVSARSTPDDKIRGFSLGADDYLTKPYVPAELASRVHAVLRRVRAHPVAPAAAAAAATSAEKAGELLTAEVFSRSPGVLLAGQLAAASLIEVLQTIGFSSISGTLYLSSRELGVLHLRDGQLLHAELRTVRGTLQGLKAWFRVASWTRGLFELRDEKRGDLPRTIEQPLQSLLLEAAYMRDELDLAWKALPSRELFLRQRGPLAPPDAPAELAVWQAVGAAGLLALEQLLDEAELPDIELLQAIGRLLHGGALAAEPARPPA